jgi:hypothetical protein
MQRSVRNRLRFAVAYVSFAIVLGLVSLTLTQCTKIGDGITGLGFKNGATTCIKGCNDTAKAVRAQCEKDHETARELCKVMPEPDRSACLAQAGATRDACNAAANADKEQCQEDCAHHQGAGSAG